MIWSFPKLPSYEDFASTVMVAAMAWMSGNVVKIRATSKGGRSAVGRIAEASATSARDAGLLGSAPSPATCVQRRIIRDQLKTQGYEEYLTEKTNNLRSL